MGGKQRSPAFARGFEDMLPREIFLKWCDLVCFGEYFVKFLSKKKIVKRFIFHTKIIDNVLLLTVFRGIGAYSPDFLSIAYFSVFWRTFSVNCLLRKYITHYVPQKKKKIIQFYCINTTEKIPTPPTNISDTSENITTPLETI